MKSKAGDVLVFGLKLTGSLKVGGIGPPPLKPEPSVPWVADSTQDAQSSGCTKTEYARATTNKPLTEGETNWASVQILALSTGEGGDPEPDPGTQPDPEPQPGPGAEPGRPGRLDNLVNTSPGLDGGCCAQAPARPGRAPWAGVALLGALLLGVRRRG